LILQKYPGLDIEFVHHAGNSSGVVDGAAALLIASASYARKRGLKPRAKIIAMANLGDCPTLMLNAPVPAAQKVLQKAGLSVKDIDLWEINEAFAVVAEKFIRDLDLDRDKVNVNGGAMALGHPIGATGSISIQMLCRSGATRAMDLPQCAQPVAWHLRLLLNEYSCYIV
jgi:acetyl-CoA C-acetyltransferase